MDWQPIETAPRDGTLILVWATDPYFAAEVVSWDEGEWCLYDYGYRPPHRKPSCITHWLPLPPPPDLIPVRNDPPPKEGDPS